MRPIYFGSTIRYRRRVTFDPPTATASPQPPENGTTLLLLWLREGNPRAATLLERRYRDQLIRFCWGYLGNVHEAEDAVQEICLKVVRAANVGEAFRSWLYKVARNHCLNLLRVRARNVDAHTLPVASHLDAALTGQLTALVRNEEHAKLEELVRALTDEQREVLRLRYVEGLTRPEIAHVLDITESVVKSRIFEGLKRLRREHPETESQRPAGA